MITRMGLRMEIRIHELKGKMQCGIARAMAVDYSPDKEKV